LGYILAVPLISLDTPYFPPGWGHCTTGQLHPKLNQKLAEAPDRWIVDGNYGNRIGPILQNQSTDI
ncbi:hypothetical protein C8R44DRAFT_560447, partial [Mycena epipterygia]